MEGDEVVVDRDRRGPGREADDGLAAVDDGGMNRPRDLAGGGEAGEKDGGQDFSRHVSRSFQGTRTAHTRGLISSP